MTINVLGSIHRIVGSLMVGARLATARFPVATLLIVIFAGLSDPLVRSMRPFDDDSMLRLMTALYGAIVSAIAARLVAEAQGWGSRLRLLLPVLAAAAIGLAIWGTSTFWIVAPTLTVAITLAIPLVPYVARSDDRRFWTFTLWTFVGVTLAFLSVLLFILGLSAILEMTRFLLNVGVGLNTYKHIYVAALTLVGPLFALGRIPRDYDDVILVGAEDKLASGIRLLVDWLAAPMALVAALVLHLYAAKILLLGEVPKNEIGWIVTSYAVFVLALRIAAEPFLGDGAVATKFFGRLWAIVLVVPAALLVYAASIRILGEGVTLERYYLSLGTLACVLVILVQVVPRARGDIRWMAGIPLALLAVSCFGPWGVAGTVGRSQTARLEAALQTRTDGRKPADLDEKERSTLRSRLESLEQVGELGRVLPLVPAGDRGPLTEPYPSSGMAVAFVDKLGLAPPEPVDPDVHISATQAPAFETSGYDLVLMERRVEPLTSHMQSSMEDGRIALDGTALVVAYRGIVDRFALLPTLAAIQLPGANPSKTAPIIADLKSAAGRELRLRLRQATFGRTSRIPSYVTVSLALRQSDWPERAAPGSLGGEGQAGKAEPGPAVGEGPR